MLSPFHFQRLFPRWAGVSRKNFIGDPMLDHAKRALKLLDNLLKAVDAHLADRDYLANQFTAADTVTGHACLISEQIGSQLSDLHNVTAYLKRLKARPALQRVLALRSEN